MGNRRVAAVSGARALNDENSPARVENVCGDSSVVCYVALDNRYTLNYILSRQMTPRPMTTFRIDAELLEGLRGVYERDGIQISEQVRRAIRMWLEAKGASATKPERERAGTRQRS